MSEVTIDWRTGGLQGGEVRTSSKQLRDLQQIFHERAALARMDPEQRVYSVQYWMPVAGGTPGGLFWGATTIEPGVVGDEYFMTQGHFHALRDRAEFYATVNGEGALILMDGNRRTWFEAMRPGSLHYISAGVAHRVANVGDGPLRFLACWPSDAGHDYETIRDCGFGARLLRRGGVPTLVREEQA